MKTKHRLQRELTCLYQVDASESTCHKDSHNRLIQTRSRSLQLVHGSLNLVVESVDGVAEVLGGNVALDLLSGRHEVVGEGLEGGVDATNHLKAVKLVLLRDLGELRNKVCANLGVLDSLLQSSLVGRGNLLTKDLRDEGRSQSGLKDTDSNKTGAERIGVDQKCDVERVKGIDTLNLLERNVLAESQ